MANREKDCRGLTKSQQNPSLLLFTKISLEARRWFLLFLFWILLRWWPDPLLQLPIAEYLKALFIIMNELLLVPLFLVVFEKFGQSSLEELGWKLSLGRMNLRYWLLRICFVFLIFVLIVNALDILGFDLKFRLLLVLNPFTIFQHLWVLPEEILFRSILCTILARRWGWFVTIAVSGTLFGLDHILFYPKPLQFLSALIPFAAGYFLSWAFYKSRVLLVPILFHMGLNAFFIFMTLYPVVWTRWVKVFLLF